MTFKCSIYDAFVAGSVDGWRIYEKSNWSISKKGSFGENHDYLEIAFLCRSLSTSIE